MANITAELRNLLAQLAQHVDEPLNYCVIGRPYLEERKLTGNWGQTELWIHDYAGAVNTAEIVIGQLMFVVTYDDPAVLAIGRIATNPEEITEGIAPIYQTYGQERYRLRLDNVYYCGEHDVAVDMERLDAARQQFPANTKNRVKKINKYLRTNGAALNDGLRIMSRHKPARVSDFYRSMAGKRHVLLSSKNPAWRRDVLPVIRHLLEADEL